MALLTGSCHVTIAVAVETNNNQNLKKRTKPDGLTILLKLKQVTIIIISTIIIIQLLYHNMHC